MRKATKGEESNPQAILLRGSRRRKTLFKKRWGRGVINTRIIPFRQTNMQVCACTDESEKTKLARKLKI